jgi:integrase
MDEAGGSNVGQDMSEPTQRKRGLYGAGSVVRKGNRWQGRFSIDGKPQKVSLGVRREVDPNGLTEAQARKRLRERQASFKLPNPLASTPFNEVAEAHITRQRLRGEISERTEYDYRLCLKNHLGPEFGKRGIGEPVPADIGRFQDKLLRKLKARSVRIYMSYLSGVFSYAVKEGMRDDNPCSEVARPKQPREEEIRVLFTVELAKVIAEIPNDDLGEVERRLYPFSARTGLRQAESIKRLRVRHLDFEGRRIRVLGKNKNGRQRTVPMSADVKAMLEAWLPLTPWNKPDDLVFAHPATGKAIDATTILQRFQRCVRKADVGEFRYDVKREGKVWPKWPKTTFHDLRHSFATSCAMAGVPIPTLKEWLGHRDIQTTMIYAHYLPAEHEADVLDRALGNAVDSVPLA